MTSPVHMPQVLAAQREEKRCAAIAGTMQRTDRILLGRVDLSVVALNDANMAPGWTTGEDIWINFAKLSGKTDEEIAALWGLNYHELAHVIFTPRIGGKLLARVMQSGRFKTALNIAEDWRIETHFSSLFAASERYFQLSFLHLALKAHEREGQPEHALFPLAAGRLYLDPVDRLRWKRAFAKRFDGLAAGDFVGDSVREWVENRRDPNHACFELNLPEAQRAERYDAAEVAERDRLLALTGTDWADELERLALRYVGYRWANDSSSPEAIQRSKAHNEAIVRDAERLMLLVAWDDPTAGGYGMPTAESGAMMGADLPSTGRVDNDLVDAAAGAALRVIAEDERQRDEIAQIIEDAGIDAHVDSAENNSGDGDGNDGDGNDGDTGGDESATTGDAEGGSGSGEGEGSPGGDDDSSSAEGQGAPTASSINVNLRQDVNDAGDAMSSSGGTGVSAGATRGGRWGNREDVNATQLTADQRAMVERLCSTAKSHGDALDREFRDLMQSRDVQRDLRAVRDAVANAIGEGTHLAKQARGERLPAPADVKGQRNRLARQLLEVRGALEGAYLDDQPTGRINLRSWLNARPSERPHSFRAWLPDEVDEAGIEVVGLIDRSSSMAAEMDHASQVTWSIASAVERAHGKSTLIGFADEDKTEVLSGRDDRVENGHYQSYGCYGSTNIAEALRKARNVLANSPMPNKLLYIVTDGGWGDLNEAMDELRIINHYADTVLVLLGAHMEREKRGCNHVVMANDVAEMGLELRRVVRRISEDALRRVNMNRGVTA